MSQKSVTRQTILIAGLLAIILLLSPYLGIRLFGSSERESGPAAKAPQSLPSRTRPSESRQNDNSDTLRKQIEKFRERSPGTQDLDREPDAPAKNRNDERTRGSRSSSDIDELLK